MVNTLYRKMVSDQVCATQTGRTHAVMNCGMESVVTRQNIVLVVTAQTTEKYIGSGENLQAHKGGGTTESVVANGFWLMEKLQNVTLTVITRVVVIGTMESVVTRRNIVLVVTAQTTE